MEIIGILFPKCRNIGVSEITFPEIPETPRFYYIWLEVITVIILVYFFGAKDPKFTDLQPMEVKGLPKKLHFLCCSCLSTLFVALGKDMSSLT